MNDSPFTMKYQAGCGPCGWMGRTWDLEIDADEELLDHATPGQHHRNMERRAG